jgi:hypothetical protein
VSVGTFGRRLLMWHSRPRLWLFRSPRPCCSPRLRASAVSSGFSDHLMSRSPDHPILAHPNRLFLTFVANKGTSANRPLCHAWVALAWPLGDPRVLPIPIPIRQWVASLHQVPNTKYRVPVFAICSIFKDLSRDITPLGAARL